MYLRLFVVPNRFLSVCLPTFFLNLKKHVRRCGDKPIYIGAVLEDGGNMRKDESKTILSNEWKELIVEDEKTKEKLVIINSDGVEITSSDLNVRLVPKE